MIDFNLKEGTAVLNNDIDLIKQQIDILFDTDKMEVLGDSTFGTHYEEFLYDLKMSADSIAYCIKKDLNSLTLFGYVPDVQVELYQGTENDIVLVKISLTKDADSYEMTIKIS